MKGCGQDASLIVQCNLLMLLTGKVMITLKANTAKMSLRYQRKILGTKDERMNDGGGFNLNKPVVQQSKVTKVAKQPIPVKGRTNISAEELSKAV